MTIDYTMRAALAETLTLADGRRWTRKAADSTSSRDWCFLVTPEGDEITIERVREHGRLAIFAAFGACTPIGPTRTPPIASQWTLAAAPARLSATSQRGCCRATAKFAPSPSSAKRATIGRSPP